jgi:hypothetical protein
MGPAGFRVWYLTNIANVICDNLPQPARSVRGDNKFSTSREMRRAIASLLVALFSFPLIASLIVVSPGTELPACCRRAGKHHCQMAGSESSGQSGAGLLQARCSFFPQTQFLPVGSASIPRPDSHRIADVSLSAIKLLGSAAYVPCLRLIETAPRRGPPLRSGFFA